MQDDVRKKPKSNEKKNIGIADTETLKVIDGELFVYQKIWIKFFVTPLFWDSVGRDFNNFFSVV